VLVAASVPAFLGVLPFALAGGGGLTYFGRTTLQNVVAPRLVQPCLWAAFLCVCVNIACLSAAAKHLEAQLEAAHATAASRPLAARCTLLLRGLPRRASRERGQLLLALLRRRFGSSVLHVFAQNDRRLERRLVAQLAAASTDAKKQVLERRLLALRARPQRGAGIAFVVFSGPGAAAAALEAMRHKRVLVRGAIGEWTDGMRWRLAAASSSEPGMYEPPMRAEPAPAPESIIWEHVGLGPAGRVLRTVAVNMVVLAVIVILASPSTLAVVAFDAAADTWDTPTRWWQRQIKRARGQGALSGFVWSFIPNVVSLLLMTYALPYLFRRATQAECHLSLGGYQRALLLKGFSFNVLNIIFVLGFGRAALATLIQRARDCDWAHDSGLTSCTQSFVHLLERLWIDNSAVSAMAVLSVAASVSISVSLLNWRLLAAHGLRYFHATRSGLNASLLDFSDDMFTGSRLLSILSATPDALVFNTAHDLCILCCALTFGILAPLVLLPGILYFVFFYAAQKWSVMSSGTGNCLSSDGRLSRAALHTMRLVTLVHTSAAVFFLYERGGKVQAALLGVVDVLLMMHASLTAMFSITSAQHTDRESAASEVDQAALMQAVSAYAGDAADDAQEGNDTDQAAYEPPVFRFTR